MIVSLDTIFGKIADNGKSIGEVRAFEELKVQETTKRSRYFFRELNYKKYVNGKITAAKKVE